MATMILPKNEFCLTYKTKHAWYIKDRSTNTDQMYLGNNNNNVSKLSNAMRFHNENDAYEYINEHNWNRWAVPVYM